MPRYTLATLFTVLILAACNNAPQPQENPNTTIDSSGATPNPSPANVGTQFSWTILGQNLTCKLDVDGNGTIDYTVENCTSRSRVVHTYGTPGSFEAKLTVTGADGITKQQSVPVTVTTPNTPPTIPSLVAGALPSSSNPLAVRFNWTVADVDADITRCRFDAESDGIWEFDNLCSGLPATSSVGKSTTTTFSYDHTYSRSGIYDATLEAADPYATGKSTVKVRVPYNRAPLINQLTANAVAGLEGRIVFQVSDPDNDTLECKLSVESIGNFTYTNCRQLSRSFTFPGSGRYQVSLEVSDGYQGKTRRNTVIAFDFGLPPALPHVIAAGDDHTCGITSSGTYCWGKNDSGQLGNSTNAGGFTPTNTPVLVDGGYAFTSLTAGGFHTCGLTASGQAYCWGKNNYGQLGTSTNLGSYTYTPLLVDGGHTFITLTAGESHTCGATNTGQAYCWGSNEFGQLGTNTNVGTTTSNPTPQAVIGAQVFTQLASRSEHTCGITLSGAAYCWGKNEFGQLGTNTNVGTTTSNPTPQQVIGSPGLSYITTGDTFSCGITSAGAAYCWGRNNYGQLGNSTSLYTYTSTPLLVDGDHNFAQMSGGERHICGVTTDNETYCWGFNQQGQLGNATALGPFDATVTPQLVVDGHAFSQVGIGNYQSCAITTSGLGYCWGMNFYGQLGTSTNSGNYSVNSSPLLVNVGATFLQPQ